MNCREFQNAIDEGTIMPNGAEDHLKGCAVCREFSGQVRLGQMLGALPRVGAPGDFDLRLNARIADGHFKDRPSIFPSLRYLMPLAAGAALIAVALFVGIYVLDTRSPAADSAGMVPLPVGNIQDETNPENNEIADLSEPPVNETVDRVERETEASGKAPSKTIPGAADRQTVRSFPKTSGGRETDGGGSRDLGVKTGETIDPPGIGANRPIAAPDIFTVTDLNEVWELIGIKTASEDKRFKVTSVAKNSVAERADVRIGDEIDAIDGVKITGEPLRGATIKVRSLTVVRNGQKKELSLQAKSQ